jgi:hypothetical protein
LMYRFGEVLNMNGAQHGRIIKEGGWSPPMDNKNDFRRTC